jgi:hypothetical protein
VERNGTLEIKGCSKLICNADVAFSPNTSNLLSGNNTADQEEGLMRICFSEAFDQEVSHALVDVGARNLLSIPGHNMC